MNSDSESIISGFINYNEKKSRALYVSIIQNIDILNQDLLVVEHNLKEIIKQSGPLENQLCCLLQSLPKPDLKLQ